KGSKSLGVARGDGFKQAAQSLIRFGKDQMTPCHKAVPSRKTGPKPKQFISSLANSRLRLFRLLPGQGRSLNEKKSRKGVTLAGGSRVHKNRWCDRRMIMATILGPERFSWRFFPSPLPAFFVAWAMALFFANTPPPLAQADPFPCFEQFFRPPPPSRVA